MARVHIFFLSIGLACLYWPTALAVSLKEPFTANVTDLIRPDSSLTAPKLDEESLVQPAPSSQEMRKSKRELAEEMVVQCAWMSSCIVPGWGQAYNGHYKKIPVMYALFGGVGGGAIYNHSYYQKFNDEAHGAYYRDAANQHRTLRDLFLIFMGMIYIGNVIDAYAGASLKTFNLSDDISIELQPQGEVPTAWGAEAGLGVSLNFKL